VERPSPDGAQFYPPFSISRRIANGYDGFLIFSLEAIPQWYTDLSLHDTNTLGLVIAAYSFGGILTIFPAPWVTDRLGRRWSITIVDIGTIGASAGQGVCTTAVQFLATRLIIGCSSLFISISTCLLLAELAHPRQLLRRWLHHSRMDLIWIPRYRQCLGLESPHYYAGVLELGPDSLCPTQSRVSGLAVSDNKSTEAKKIPVHYHPNGDDGDEIVNFEYAEIWASIELTKSQKVGWTTLFAKAGNRKRVILCVGLGLSVQWVGSGIVSYHFAPVIEPVGITNPTE
jgi:hypothetical protein